MQSHPLRRTCSACSVDLSASDLHTCLVPSFLTPRPHCTENTQLNETAVYQHTFMKLKIKKKLKLGHNCEILVTFNYRC